MKRHFRLLHAPHPSRSLAQAALRDAPDGSVVVIDDEPPRNLEQNAAQWVILDEISKARQWPVNGVMVHLSAEEWKDILTAAFEGETAPRLAAGYGGGVVMLGRRTSQYGKRRFSEWLDWLNAAAVELLQDHPACRPGNACTPP